MAMMVDNLWVKILWVVVYGITCYYTFTGQMMPAMYWMAGGMLAQSVVDLVYYFMPHHSMKMNEKSM